MLPGLSGGFDTLAAYSLAQGKGKYGFNSLNCVSVNIYVELLKAHVNGVRFGIVRNGEVVWE